MDATSVSKPSLPLTFGLEFEHILAFHSSILLPLLPPGTEIIKSIPRSTRLALRQTTSQYLLTRPTYNSWALTSPTDYTSPFGDDWHNQCLKEHGMRGYADEILRLEQALLRSAGCEDNIVIHNGKGKIKHFNKWHLVTDTSLVGATPEELSAILDTHKPSAIKEDWDSAPVELVSRVLSLDDSASFAEIENMLAFLRGGEKNHHRHQAFTDQWCGLHVHIGTRTGFTLPLLQHLAYILIIYEPILSTLHPASRRPGHRNAEQDLVSNREAFYEEPDFSDVDWDAVDVDGLDSGYASDDDGCGVLLEFPYRKKDDEEEQQRKEDEAFELRMQKRARELVFKQGMTVEGLCGLMSGNQKGRV
ncbi:MAG: hypothetical protein Q9225_006444, partial [Loekoesia sp. 1 TL-2023]